AQQSAHPYSLCLALYAVATFHQYRREVRATQEHAEATISLATEQEFTYWRARSSLLRGWTLAHQGQGKEGIELIHQDMIAYRAIGGEIGRPYSLGLLAEAHGAIGEPETGLTALAEALVHVEHTGERYYEAEIHRLKGVLLLQQNSNNQAEAENCFHHVLDIARSQQARSFELRAATS